MGSVGGEERGKENSLVGRTNPRWDIWQQPHICQTPGKCGPPATCAVTNELGAFLRPLILTILASGPLAVKPTWNRTVSPSCKLFVAAGCSPKRDLEILGDRKDASPCTSEWLDSPSKNG